VQFTIEKSQLTVDSHQGAAIDSEPTTAVVEASDSEDAVFKYLAEESSELMSHVHPLWGAESVATVRKDDALYMLRIYPN
jgi:hypothetical protein